MGNKTIKGIMTYIVSCNFLLTFHKVLHFVNAHLTREAARRNFEIICIVKNSSANITGRRILFFGIQTNDAAS